MEWVNLIGFNNENLALTYTVTSYVTPGDEYRLKVRAKNYWGWSEFSEVLIIKAATWPTNMVAVTTSVDATTGGIKVSWTKPYDNEQTITAYHLQFADATGSSWIDELTYCDGSKATIVSSRSCIIPMSVFRAAPFNYVFRDLVKVKAKAYNSFGWALEFSPANTVGA